MIEFIGRLHPLIVHLPVAVLLLASLLFFLTRLKKFKGLKAAHRISILVGSLAAVLSCISGFMLSNESFDLIQINNHKYWGIGTAFISLIILYMTNSKPLAKKLKFYGIGSLYVLMIPSLIMAGHLGGSITHGENFLFQEVTDSKVHNSKVIGPNDPLYEALIKPILQEKCYDCHSSKKQKGKLRLDASEFIAKGGKGGEIINNLNPDQSEFLIRIHLPLEDEDHMPPSDNTQLNSSEIDLITLWIEAGASFNQPIKDYRDSLLVKSFSNSFHKQDQTIWWPEEYVAKPDQKLINRLIELNVSVEFLSQENNYIEISLISLESVTENIWTVISELKDHIVSIRFSGVKINQADINNISNLTSLRKLFLDNALNQELSIAKLLSLKNLFYLNLSQNKISDEQFNEIQTLKNLSKLYLFSSELSEMKIIKLKDVLPNCEIISDNFSLPVLETDTIVYRKKN